MPRRKTSTTKAAVIGCAITGTLLCLVMAMTWVVNADFASFRQWEYNSADRLGDSQLANARTIIAVGKGADMSDEAIEIALMTAMQESTLENLDHGDRDSLGLFQQRPSQGWGDTHQVTDPVWSTKAFFGINPEVANPGLMQIDGWEDMSPTEAAQAVQKSAYPDAYAQWESLSAEILTNEYNVQAIS